MQKPKILFISHSFPPIVGGVESQNSNLSKALSQLTEVKIIANKKGKYWLPVFLPITFIKAFFLMTVYDYCLLGNGVLAPLGAVLKFFHPRKKFFCVIHGLDLTYARQEGLLPKIYCTINIPSIKTLDKLFMVSNATIEEALQFNIKREQCVFIPNGVFVQELKKTHNRQELSRIFGKNIENKKVLLRLGRFVPHKGTSWFIRNVMPLLEESYVMIAAGFRVGKNTAGDKDDFRECEQAIIDMKLEDRVKLLPSISQKEIAVLLNTVDMVVSPNIPLTGSMEGFGINVIEAGACERVVLASELEGLSDAIHNGKNGFFVEPKKENRWKIKIDAIFSAGDNFMKAFGKRTGKYVAKNFSWESIAQKYLNEMNRK
jgi:phosphatidylinositol alpha-1,6-mannosyltransferase